MNAETDRLKRKYRSLKRTECLMHRKDNDMNRFVVPYQLKPRILKELHNSTRGDYIEIARTYEKVLQKHWWGGLIANVQN